MSLSPQALLPTKPIPPSEALPNTPLPLAEVVKNLSGGNNPDPQTTTVNISAASSESPVPSVGGRATIYSCDQCDKTFTKKSSITRHKYEHSGWFFGNGSRCLKSLI